MSITNSQYDAIIREYEARQHANRNLMQQRREELYRAIPSLADYDNAVVTIAQRNAQKLLLDNDTSALLSLKEEVHRMHQEKEELIVRHGFPADYLDPIYSCSDCKDTGYVDNKKCHCFKKAIVDLLYTQSNLQAWLEQENFSTFDISLYSDRFIDPTTQRSSLKTMQYTLDTCKNFIDTFGVGSNNLFFYGDTGVGKTFLSNCIAKELMDRSFSVIYFSAFSLFDILAQNKFKKEESSDFSNEHIFDCDLLIIDDLGTELTNSFISSEFFHCINERILRQKSTIISTNLSVSALRDRYSERTFSRITSNYTMLKLIGDDIRLKKKLLNMEDA